MTRETGASELMRLLEIQLDEATPTLVRGTIAADERHHQPWGLVHGGLYTAAIETFATVGAYEAVKVDGRQAVGIANITDFLRSHKSGRLEVVASAIHQSRTQQLWQVDVRRLTDGVMVARGHVRLENIDPRPG